MQSDSLKKLRDDVAHAEKMMVKAEANLARWSSAWADASLALDRAIDERLGRKPSGFNHDQSELDPL